MKVKFIENPGAVPANYRKGVFMGYCPECKLMVADFDRAEVMYTCAGCGAKFKIPLEKRPIDDKD